MQGVAYDLMAQARGLALSSAEGTVPVVLQGFDENDYPVRIGLWPLVSSSAPETAMGMMTLLGLLLERYRDTAVYRLFVQVDDAPEGFEWTMVASQFGVDDWQLDELDENVGIWGMLEQANGRWTLQIEVENDLAADSDVLELQREARTLSELVNALPAVAAEIMAASNATDEKVIAPVMPETVADDTSLAALLRAAFTCERQLMLHLWGVEWVAGALEADARALADAAAAVSDDFAAWLVAQQIGRLMWPATPEFADVVTPLADELVERFTEAEAPAVVLGTNLLRLGSDQDALDLLDEAAANQPESAMIRLALALAYQQARKTPEMINTLQQAIEDEATTNDLFLVYANLVATLRQNGLVLPRYILIDAPDREFESMANEAIAAYDAVLDANPAHTRALYRRALLRLEAGDEGLWDDVAQLVKLDKDGLLVRQLVESFQVLDELDEGINVLSDAVEQQPERADLRVSLAVALLADDAGDEAREQLEAAYELVDDGDLRADIERLLLAANDPEFDMRLGEITDQINAQRPISQRDIAFLEDAIEQAPSFGQGYVLLAQAYRQQGDAGAALETLLDAQKTLPDDPEVTEQLARVLWTSGERDLAFDFLNKGLGHHPNSVPLLALTGQFLYDDGQEEEARAFLSRAESLSPTNRVLREVQQHIARTLDD